MKSINFIPAVAVNSLSIIRSVYPCSNKVNKRQIAVSRSSRLISVSTLALEANNKHFIMVIKFI